MMTFLKNFTRVFQIDLEIVVTVSKLDVGDWRLSSTNNNNQNMGTQFVVRSYQNTRPLKLRTILFDSVSVNRYREDGVTVFELCDEDVEIELIVRRRRAVDVVATVGSIAEVAMGPDGSRAAVPGEAKSR